MNIRLLAPDDDLLTLTDIIHAAYARRAADNLRYWATHQMVEDTARRFQSGQGLIAEQDGRVIGTLTVRPPQADSEVLAYRDPGTWSLCQFAVLPELQGQGVGRRLHQAALAYVRTQGGHTTALDTAVPATDLIDIYLRWGYTRIGEVDWRPFTNYVSVVMTRPLRPEDAIQVP
jgi:GNAT superfamily N-acetyltransferase